MLIVCSTSFFHKAEFIVTGGSRKKDNMMRAITAIRNKEMGLLRASKVFGMPKSILTDKVKSTE
jgi:hypothetical protein